MKKMKSHSRYLEPEEVSQAYDASDPVSYLWDLAMEAVDNSITKYPMLSGENGVAVTEDWLDPDSHTACDPYDLIVVGADEDDNEWSPHGMIYETGILFAIQQAQSQ